MADGLLGLRDVAGPPARLPPVPARPPRQTLPLIQPSGYMVVSTESGKAAVVTAAPSIHREPQPGLIVDSNTFITPPTPTILSSTLSASTPIQAASASLMPTSTPSRGLSKGKLAAAIVVPVVLLAFLTPIAIVWWISRRRKQRAAKRRSDRSSRQRKPLLDYYGGSSNLSRSCSYRAASRIALSRPKLASRIVSVPPPTSSSFHFELSRPASAGPFSSSSPRSAHRPIPRYPRSATFPWGAPPPYTSPARTAFSSPSVARLDTPDISGLPLRGSAEMVHIRPIGEQRSNSRMTAHGTPVRSRTSSTASYYQAQDNAQASMMLQPPDAARTRQKSVDSTAESLHFRSSLQRPFSFQPLASPALSDISGFSFDPTLWASTTYGCDFIVSPIEDEDEERQVRPHGMI